MSVRKIKFILLLTLTLPKFIFADSPLTSTPFYKEYTDVDIVLHAEQFGMMDREIADYLHNPDNPIDVKAAVINALGWDKNGRSDADLYMSIIYNSAGVSQELLDANVPESFVVGYLYAMDNYHDVKGAESYLKMAQDQLSDSYTVNIIYNIVRAQKIMDESFCKAWKYTNDVFLNDQLQMDMREDARKVIYDYMILYKGYCTQDEN